MARLGPRMRAHMLRVLSQHQPTKGESTTHQACLAWLAPPSASPAPAQLDARQLQAELVEHCGKAAPLQSSEPGFWIRLGRLAAKKGVEPGQLGVVGRWVDQQDWLRSVTLSDLLMKWEDWYAKAKRAESGVAPALASRGDRKGASAW